MAFSVERIRDLYDFSSHFLRVRKLNYHYLDEGNGDPIIMLHGNPTWSFMYRELIRALRDSYHVVVPDHIGCGLSEKPGAEDYDYTLSRRVADLESLLQYLNLTRNLTLVLHDWGGLIGMAFAARNPSTIARLIIFNTAAFLLPAGEPLHWALRFCKRSPLAGYLIRRLNAFAFFAGFLGCRRRRLPGPVRRAYKAPYDSWENRIAVLRFVQDIPLSNRDPSYAVLQKTQRELYRFQRTPCLICWGKKDFIFNESFLREWRRRFPQAEFHGFADIGHNIVEDAGVELVPLIRDFLSRHPLGP